MFDQALITACRLRRHEPTHKSNKTNSTGDYDLVMKTITTVMTLLWFCAAAAANIHSHVPQRGEMNPAAMSGDYNYSPLNAGSIVPIDISGTFSSRCKE